MNFNASSRSVLMIISADTASCDRLQKSWSKNPY